MISHRLSIRIRNEVSGMAVVLVAFTGLLFLQYCSNESMNPSPDQQRPWLYEHEFAKDPSLAAAPHQVVILHLRPGDQAMAHAVPYVFSEGGSYLFGIPSDDPFITHAELYDQNGSLVLSVKQGDGGFYKDLPAGNYSLKVFHNGSDVPEKGTPAFIRLQQSGQTEQGEEDRSLEQNGTSSLIAPRFPAYVALNISGGGQDGSVFSMENGEWAVEAEDSAVFMAQALDWPASSYWFKKHLFSFEPTNNCTCSYLGPLVDEECYYLHSFSRPSPRYVLSAKSFKCRDVPRFCPKSSQPLTQIEMPCFAEKSDLLNALSISPVGDGEMVFWANMYQSFYCSPIFFAENGRAYFAQAYPNVTGIPSFGVIEGIRWYREEDAIDPMKIQAGEVALYESENYAGVQAVLSAPLTITKLLGFRNIASLHLGHHTLTTARFDMKDGAVRFIGVETPKMAISPDDVSSIKTFDSMKLLISSQKCPYCNLAGADLSGLAMDGYDLSYANLMQASLNDSSLKKTDMRYALLNGANLNYANLEGANLCGASLQGTAASNNIAATLEYAYLKNVNLANANLSGTACAYVNFFSDYAGTCGVDDNCGFSTYCATAASATLDGADFTNAYLNGVDFSKASIRGVTFTNAMLEGASFIGANLGQDPATGAQTRFTEAFLEGADFSNALVTGADFTNAFVSSGQGGACMLFALTGDHTQFKGFWGTSGDPICVTFAYTQGTILPSTSSDNTCPDGHSGPCGDANWYNPKIPMNQTTQKASICEAVEPICTDVDFNW